MSEQTPSFNVIGAGLAGSLMALYLARKGYQVHVYERRPDMRKAAVEGGRSINLALSARGMHALRETGLLDEIMTLALPMYGRMMHDLEGGITYQPYSHDPRECIYSVSRAELNIRLMNHSEAHTRTTYYFDHRCEDVDLESGEIILRHLPSGELRTAAGTRTIASDGAFSAVRYALQKTPRFNFSQSYLDHGYKELTIPPGPDGNFALDPKALHIWPRGQFMMIALPNPDRTFTCTLFFPFEGPLSFASLQTEEEVVTFFAQQFPDAVPLMPTLLEDYFHNPTGSLVTIRCAPWILGDRIALLGDAAHAIVPFFGQGMNAAFEDCATMSACIDQYAPDWGQVFEQYQQQRKENSDAIATMALENYIEMRDKVADEEFLFRKAVEHHLEAHLDSYRSRYELVSFTRVPYAEALRRGQQNQAILAELTRGLDSPQEVDLAEAARLVAESLG
ncbi:MAG: FAD-dependent monooxygenase [Bacteroidetes bacterium]|nr:MAG: FAD-dependent monooxygenase [Bacteroidota bacterium]